MTTDDGTAHAAALSPPVLLIVDADPQARAVTESALARRFGPDYQVLAATTPQGGLDALQRLADHDGDVALVAADLHLPGMDGVEFLERAHALHPNSWRVLLVAMDRYHTRLPFTELATLQRATALGRIDFSVVKGWVTPEEWLYPQIQEALSSWTITHRPSHVIYRVVGEQWAPRSHELRDTLTRNSIPFEFYATDSEAGQQLITEFNIDVRHLPAVIHHDGSVQHDPSLADVAASHGIQTRPSPGVYDLAIVGAGPAGLAAAVYGASEGLRTVILEPHAIGGQAGTSSMIRNYLGFPRGISGGGLAHRAWEQAVLFGAELVYSHEATGLSPQGDHHVIALGDETQAAARAVIIAAGVAYRRLGIPALDRLIGAGVFYGAAGVEAPAMAGEHVYVVGGANSAGQAALHLARFAARVTLLVRRESLAASMSDYLITQLEATPKVDVRFCTRVADGHGPARLEALTLEDARTGRSEQVPAVAVFVMIGAEPCTQWLRNLIRLDNRGFILTARDVPPESWPLTRAPLPFETSLPGVFAVGDIRYGSVKRVAGAVGEGSVAVGAVHQYLTEPRPGTGTASQASIKPAKLKS
jgi:thioredoxin reductase (NADPH)